MAKRFIDTNIWNKRWFCELKPTHKLFWIYAFTNCDHAGFLEFHPKKFHFDIGGTVDIKELRTVFGQRIIDVQDGDKWFLPEFIEYQYGTLSETNRVHKSVLDILKRRGLEGSYKGLIRGIHDLKDKDKDKDKDLSKDIVKRKDKSLDTIVVEEWQRIEEFREIDVNLHYNEFRDWLRAEGKIKKDYHSAFRNWLRRSIQKGWAKKLGQVNKIIEMYCSICETRHQEESGKNHICCGVRMMNKLEFQAYTGGQNVS